MTATIDPNSLPSTPESVTIGVLERNRAVLQRAARIIRAAASLDWVAAEDEPLRLRSQLAEEARLLACAELDVALLLDWGFRQARIAVWSHDPLAKLLDLAMRDDRLVSLIGWPTFQSMPRAWEIALATRRILRPGPESTMLGDLFTGTPVTAEFQPRTQADRSAVVSDVVALFERTGGADRAGARIGEVPHELVMNATYDAPVDVRGEPCYAHDRREPVVLRDSELPIVQFATDGILVAIQVVDRFGRLTRDDVLASIHRGYTAGRSSAVDVVESATGGAGIGLWRVYSSSAVTIVDVVPGHTTAVTAVFDVDVAPRDARTMPPSLHLFDQGRLG